MLETLAGKRYFSFLDGFSGYNQIRIAQKDQGETTFTYTWGTYAYKVLPFGLCNPLAIFQREILGIFSDLLHDCVEVYMDDFIVMGDTFEEDVHNIRRVFVIQQNDLLINSEGKDKMTEEKTTITGLDSTITLVAH